MNGSGHSTDPGFTSNWTRASDDDLDDEKSSKATSVAIDLSQLCIVQSSAAALARSGGLYSIQQGSYMSWKTWKKIFVMECHGNVMEFYFSGKVMEMSWNFTKMSWKKSIFTIP